MAMGTSLVALALVAAGEAPAAIAVPPPIYYQAKVMTIVGTNWRSESFHRMRPVARQGTSTIWTADRALAESLAKSAKSSTVTPKVQASESLTLNKTQVRSFVTHLERVSDGPINQATKVAYIPEVASLSESFQVTVGGRRIDQGILANVALEDAHLVRVEVVALPEMLKNTPKAAENGTIEVAQKVLRTVLNGDSEIPETSVQGQVQIPEIATGRAQGEWLVPDDSVLVVSLGIHTTADAKGMAVTEERLAIVDFDPKPLQPISTESLIPAAGGGQAGFMVPVPFVAGEPLPIAVANLPQATPPSRSLPRSIDVDGKEVDLPPLPEGVAAADLNQIEPGSKLASPQMNIKRPMADPALARTSFVEDSVSPVPVMGDFARMPLYDFARRLFERMGEYEMDIDFAADGRSCQISLRDANAGTTGVDPACPAEPRCDNGKEVDPAVGLAALVNDRVKSMVKKQVFEMTLPGEDLNFEIISGSQGLRMPKSSLAEPKPACPDCDECLKEMDASCPIGKDPMVSVFEMIVNRLVADAPKPTSTSVDLRPALTSPGQSEITIVPLSDKLSLEIKATVVPKVQATATKAGSGTPR